MKKQKPTCLDHLLSLSLLLLATSSAFAQSTAISYQGRLTESGSPATGIFDMQFKLFDTAAVSSGAQQGGTIAKSAVPVTNGVFTVTLDFGVAVFDGSARFLEAGARRGSSNPYTTLAPRQQITSVPYAIQSRNAMQLAGLPSTSFVQANTDGNIAIGKASPATGIRLDVKGSTLLEPGGSGGGFIQFHTPDTETGMTISGSGTKRADVRFDGSTLKLVATAAAGPPSSTNGIAITTAGNVGIGTASPAAGIRLDVKGSTLLEPGGSGGRFIQFHTPDTETGMTISGSGTKRADIRFDGSTLKLVAANAAGPPPSGNGIAITTAGNVGIGTTAPVAKLHSETSQANTAAVYGKATGAGGVGVYGQSAVGAAVHAEGNATQARDKGGFVKAMAYIDPFLPAAQYVVRSYNSQTDRPITVRRETVGWYVIDFAFNVQDRFVSLTPQATTGVGLGVVVGTIIGTSGSLVTVVFDRIDTDTRDYAETRFHIIVY